MTSGMQPFKVLGGQLGREPVACVRRGTIHIFHVGMDRAIYHKAWDGINYHPNEGFERLEGYFLDGIAAVSCARDEVSVFAIGVKTGKLHHYRWTEEEGWKLQENIPGEWGGSLSVATLKYKCWDLFGLDLKSKIIRVSYSKDADGKKQLPSMFLNINPSQENQPSNTKNWKASGRPFPQSFQHPDVSTSSP